MADETVAPRKGACLPANCESRPETGSLHHPVAEAASSSVDVLEAGRFFIMR